jgi:transcriptional regulator with XRE-family HTH domain
MTVSFEDVGQIIRYLTPRELHDLLTKAGLNEEEFAVAIGVTRRSVERWLSGQYPIPALVCSVAKLLAKKRITVRALIMARLQ